MFTYTVGQVTKCYIEVFCKFLYFQSVHTMLSCCMYTTVVLLIAQVSVYVPSFEMTTVSVRTNNVLIKQKKKLSLENFEKPS